MRKSLKLNLISILISIMHEVKVRYKLPQNFRHAPYIILLIKNYTAAIHLILGVWPHMTS